MVMEAPKKRSANYDGIGCVTCGRFIEVLGRGVTRVFTDDETP
jgi:hypothetical protein